jgi:hypothetical protein
MYRHHCVSLPPAAIVPAGEGETAGMTFIPGGGFMMGSERHRPEEHFVQTVRRLLESEHTFVGRLGKHDRSGGEHARREFGMRVGIATFSERQVSGRFYELAELGVGHFVPIDPEAVDANPMTRDEV